MKKTLLFFAVVCAFSLASCKKDRTCTCTTTYPDGSTDTQAGVFNKASKSSAKKACVSYTTSDASGITTTKCDLK